MRLSFRHLNLGDACEFWNSVAPPDFQMEVGTLTHCVVGCPCFDWGASSAWLVDGQIAALAWVKKSAAHAYAGPDPEVTHLSAIAFRESSIGGDLLEDIRNLLRQRGRSAIQFGQDARHLFPGVPESWHGLREFLEIEGFVPKPADVCVDLRLDLADGEWTSDPRVRRCALEDIPALLSFLDREFPGRWAHDVRDKLAHEVDPSFIYLWADPDIQGFAMTQTARHRLRIAGATLVGGLPEPWSAVGPIGVSAERRGKGEGTAFLNGILADLKAREYRGVRVDWTRLTDWYTRFGFAVERRYVPMQLNLDDTF